MSNGPNLGQVEYLAQGAVWYTELKALLRAIDGLVQPSVKDKDLTAPPGGEANGDRYIVGAGASGAWSGKDGKIARYQTDDGTMSAGYEFYTPSEGWLVEVQDENTYYSHNGAAWVKLATLLTASDLAGTLAETHGGTNQTTYTTGDTLYASGANTLAKLGIGGTGKRLTVVAGVPSWTYPAVTSKTSTYTAAAGDEVILVSASGGAVTINLPAVASSTGLRFTVVKTDATANAVTLDGNASETIDGATTLAISTQYQAYTVQCDGAAWYVIYAYNATAGATPTGSAGGDLTGTYPNPTIKNDVALGGNPTTTTQASGDSSTRIATTAFVADAVAKQKECLIIAVSDETTAITTGTAKVTFRMPFAMTLTEVRASLSASSSSGNPAFDVNEAGVSIFSTTLTIDSGEKTSTTAATPAVISDSSLADDAEMTVDIDVAGTGAKGAKIYLIGTRT